VKEGGGAGPRGEVGEGAKWKAGQESGQGGACGRGDGGRRGEDGSTGGRKGWMGKRLSGEGLWGWGANKVGRGGSEERSRSRRGGKKEGKWGVKKLAGRGRESRGGGGGTRQSKKNKTSWGHSSSCGVTDRSVRSRLRGRGRTEHGNSCDAEGA